MGYGRGRVLKESRSSVVRWFGMILAAGMLASVISFLAVTPEVRGEEPGRETQIVGGRGVPDGTYPFIASIQSARQTGHHGHFCGGTLIDSDSILTAAHCVSGIGNSNTFYSTNFRSIRVVVGRTDLSSDRGEVRRIARLSDISIHPNYNPNTSVYDAAVINLSEPVYGIKPARLSTTNLDKLEKPGRTATVAGWGNTVRQSSQSSGGVRYPSRMRHVSVPVVSDDRARNVYPNYAPALMLAAGREGADSCQGDSGGPLFRMVGSRQIQIGITSFGRGCGARGNPGVYTEVNAQKTRSFIVRAASN